MVRREIWPFLRVAVSPKLERSCPPKLVYMHVTSTPTCMNFLSRFRLQLNFLMTMDYSPWSERENLPVFEGSSISETGKVMPTKIGVHACYINPLICMNFFEPIRHMTLNFLMTMDYTSMRQKGKFGRF